MRRCLVLTYICYGAHIHCFEIFLVIIQEKMCCIEDIKSLPFQRKTRFCPENSVRIVHFLINLGFGIRGNLFAGSLSGLAWSRLRRHTCRRTWCQVCYVCFKSFALMNNYRMCRVVMCSRCTPLSTVTPPEFDAAWGREQRHCGTAPAVVTTGETAESPEAWLCFQSWRGCGISRSRSSWSSWRVRPPSHPDNSLACSRYRWNGECSGVAVWTAPWPWLKLSQLDMENRGNWKITTTGILHLQ